MQRTAFVFALCLFVAANFVAAKAVSENMEDDPEHWIGITLNCADPCVVTHSGGGIAGPFIYAGKHIQNGARSQVIIDGECVSACALLADYARPRACITEKAVFKFHKAAFTPFPHVRFDPDHNKDIAAWVERHGGFPEEGYLEMRFIAAKRFWPECAK